MGSGAGFPSIPLKILYPNLKVTIVDSLNKRIKFFKSSKRRTRINDCNFIHARERKNLVKIKSIEGFQNSYSKSSGKIKCTFRTMFTIIVKKNGYF